MESIFFDSNVTYEEGLPKYDRPGSAADLRRVFGGLFKNGVFSLPQNSLAVTNGVGLKVQLSPGMCCINGAFGWAAAGETLELPPADLTYPRRDVIALRFSLDNDKRNIEPIVIKGTAAKTPQIPTLTRNADIFDLGLAVVTVDVKAMSLTPSKITDTRMDVSRCGFVTGAITQVDTATLFNQLQSVVLENQLYYTEKFQEWFTQLKETLNENATGNLYTRLLTQPKIIISNQSTKPPVENGAILIW